MTEKAQNFQSELKALILKYKPEIEVAKEYYTSETTDIHFSVDGFLCVTQRLDCGPEFWDFGNGVINIKTKNIIQTKKQ